MPDPSSTPTTRPPRRPTTAGGESAAGAAPAYLTVRQAAAQLGVSRQTIEALILAGRLPTYRPGVQHLLRPADLAALIRRAPGRPPRSRPELPVSQSPGSGPASAA